MSDQAGLEAMIAKMRLELEQEKEARADAEKRAQEELHQEKKARAEAERQAQEAHRALQAARAGPKEADESVLERRFLVDPELIRAAFLEPFIERKKSRWLTELRKIALTFDGDKNDAPCLAVFQSSGYGKTRLLLDGTAERYDGEAGTLSTKLHRLYFHCGFLERHAQNGWPRPPVNKFLAQAFPVHESNVVFSQAVTTLSSFMLCALVSYFRKGAERSSALEFKDASQRPAFVQYGTAFEEDDTWRTWVNWVSGGLHGGFVHNLRQDLLTQVSGQGKSVVIMIWDEAAAMKSRVLHVTDDEDPTSNSALQVSVRPIFRRACYELHTWLQDTGACVAHGLVATTSHVKTAASIDVTDESLRFMSRDVERYDPMTGLVDEHMDIFPKDHRAPFDSSRERIDGDERIDSDDVWQYGRPVWKSIQGKEEQEAKYHWAAAKLLCTTKVSSVNVKSLSKPQLLAILFSRVAGFLVPTERAEAMVASHMATAISYNDTGILAQYISEPALAEGSKHVLRHLGWTMCAKEFVDRICAEMSKSPPNAGDLGELVACMLLLHVGDSFPDSKLATSIGAAKFLDRLVGNDWQDRLQDRLSSGGHDTRQAGKRRSNKFVQAMQRGLVSFNHFVRVKHVTKDKAKSEWPKLLRWAWARQAAIICAAGQAGIDLVIPIFYEVTADGTWALGCFIVQVKNTDDLCPTEAQASVIGWSSVDDDVFAGIYLGLRLRTSTSPTHTAWTADMSGPTPALIANSFECLAFLSAEDRTALANLGSLHTKSTVWVENERYNSSSEFYRVMKD